MKVKIGDMVYDSNDTPIMLVLDKQDKANINNMHEEASKFITYPSTMPVDKARKFADSYIPTEI